MCTRLAWLLLGTLSMPAFSDEGMWLLNDPPRQQLKEKYGFDLTDDWLEHARLASVRFNNGGSGSFVSPNGLLITNHHIAADALQKLSTPERDLFRDGFAAKTPADELKCPDLELNVLQSIEDVTDRVNAAVKPEMKPAEAFAARRAAMSAIEKESLDKTGLRSDVVTLYQGGAYHLYRYKKYTDVRLVFAPEEKIAAFGGDVDNFEFPRFRLDVSFFRAYEDGKPAQVEALVQVQYRGGEGRGPRVRHRPPGHDQPARNAGEAETPPRRDAAVHPGPHAGDGGGPLAVRRARPGEPPPGHHRSASVANARKAFAGQYQGLLNPQVLAMKEAQGARLFYPIPTTPGSEPHRKAYDDAVRRIADVQAVYATFEKPHNLLETGTPSRRPCSPSPGTSCG